MTYKNLQTTLFTDHFQKTEPSYKDESLLVNAIVCTLEIIPGFYYWALEEVHFVKLINIHFLAPLAFTSVMSSIVLVDWIFVTVYVLSALLYTNVTRISLNQMK